MLRYLTLCLVAVLGIGSGEATPRKDGGNAQPQVIELWDGAIPGAIDDPEYKEEIVYSDAAKTKPRVTKVTTPTLTVYRPVGENKHVGVVICPGGGYVRLSIDNEGTLVAQEFAKAGYTAFVLKYRLPSERIMKQKWFGPLSDAQRAIRLVRSRASEFGIDPSKIGIMGFSAGGSLAATASTLYDVKAYDPGKDTTSARPDFSILCYPVISMRPDLTHSVSRSSLIGGAPNESELEKLFSADENIDENTPPAFLLHSADDAAVSSLNTIRYAERMVEMGLTPDVHMFRKGGHGFGLGEGLRSVVWTRMAMSWLEECIVGREAEQAERAAKMGSQSDEVRRLQTMQAQLRRQKIEIGKMQRILDRQKKDIERQQQQLDKEGRSQRKGGQRQGGK